jgi:hypothetical protein
MFNFHRRSARIRHSIQIDARIAHYVIPLIERLCRDDCDGDAYRCSVREWHHAERPVLDALRGTASLFLIDGPRHGIGDDLFALGSLIESPGVTAHLDPVETLQLETRVRQAIEQEVLNWIAEHRLQNRPPADRSVDRSIEDPKAVQRMIEWTARSRRIKALSDAG